MGSSLVDIISMIPAILIAFTFHEYAHALVADRLGDKTPKFQGRLTLNPIAHIDPIGFLAILIFRFGWAKPVEVNPRAFKNYYKDDLKVSVAGPIANIVVAIASAAIIALIYKFFPMQAFSSDKVAVIIKLLNITVSLNCMFAIFNLIPIPGLDGFHILRDLFPRQFYKFSDMAYRYQMIIILIFIATPISNILIGKPASRLYILIMSMFGLF